MVIFVYCFHSQRAIHTIEPNDDGLAYLIAVNIVKGQNISTPDVLPNGCFDVLCNPNVTDEMRESLTVQQLALHRCVFEDDLMGLDLKYQVLGIEDIQPMDLIQCYVINLLGLSLGMETWLNNDGWIEANSNECEWLGIECECSNDVCKKESVVEIKLPMNNLTGTLPGAELSNLPYLRRLELWDNELHGDTVPILGMYTFEQIILG